METGLLNKGIYLLKIIIDKMKRKKQLIKMKNYLKKNNYL